VKVIWKNKVKEKQFYYLMTSTFFVDHRLQMLGRVNGVNSSERCEGRQWCINHKCGEKKITQTWKTRKTDKTQTERENL